MVDLASRSTWRAEIANVITRLLEAQDAQCATAKLNLLDEGCLESDPLPVEQPITRFASASPFPDALCLNVCRRSYKRETE